MNRIIKPIKKYMKKHFQIVRFDMILEQVVLISPFDVAFRPASTVFSKKLVNTFENFDATNGLDNTKATLMACNKVRLKTSAVLI